MLRLQLALEQIEAARSYTLALLDSVPHGDWFRIPAAGVSHVGWQAGHLALAEYRLTLERIRGRPAAEEALISNHFLELFGRGSAPDPDPQTYPAPAEILRTLAAVHAQTMRETALWTSAQLTEPVSTPHPQFSTRLGALFWCARHEMLHAGQIGLLRRQLGQPPLW